MRIKIIIFVSIVFVTQLYAQTTINSPYSSYGLGERGAFENATFTGLGLSNITYFDSTVLNYFNPATYNTLGDGQPLFSFGINSRLSFLEQNNVNEFKGNTIVDHFAMAFTIKKHFGLAFGLKPFARKGYNMSETIAVGTDSIHYTYLGNGGANQVFLGLSSNLIKIRTTTLSVGANLSYLFGASTNERRSQLIGDGLLGGVDWKAIRVNAFYYDLGLYFRQTIRKVHHLTIAATVDPGQNIKITKDEYLFFGSVGNPLQYDTLYASADQIGEIYLPATATVGLNYNFWFKDITRKNSTRNSEIGVHLNYSATDWTKFSNSFASSNNLLATNKFTVGIQYTPERSFLEKSANASFLSTVRYRAGFYQYKLPYSYGGQQLSDMGATLGFGIPILAQQSLSNINIGFSVGKRETSATGSLNEKYIGINLGIVLAPANFERWFRKRKLD